MLYIKKANYEDIEEEYNFIKATPPAENGFHNHFFLVEHENFNKNCLDYLILLSKLPKKVNELTPTTTFFLWLDNKIIGIFYVLHELTEEQKNKHGHISYSILKDYRNKGYATKGLSLVIEESKKFIKEDEIYMHAYKTNPISLKVMLNNGAYIAKETEIDYFTRIKLR